MFIILGVQEIDQHVLIVITYNCTIPCLKNKFYEVMIWAHLEEDNCNFYAPKGIGSGGGGSESNGVGNCDDLDTCR